MNPAIAHAREIRRRLWNPPNGHASSELEVVADPIRRRVRVNQQKRIDIIERHRSASKRDLTPTAEPKLDARLINVIRSEVATQVDAALPRIINEVVTRRVEELAAGREPRPIAIADIQRIVAAAYGCKRRDVLGERRTASVGRPRQIGMFIAKRLTHRSRSEIGRRFGGRDHTTVLHALNKIERLVETDPAVNAEIAALETAIREALGLPHEGWEA